MTGRIHVGIGGWNFPEWRGPFYPAGLPQARELEHAAGRLTAIEINATYYRAQAPASFAKWAAAVPPGFRFTIKASRYATNRKVLADAAESVARVVGQGLTELGDALGPILWQFAPTKAYDRDDFGAFLALLPDRVDGVALRHAVEVRHDSFRDPDFAALAAEHGVAVVRADHAKYPEIDVAAGGFHYLRLQRTQDDEPAGYGPDALDHWTAVARDLARSGDVYLFVIGGAKVRNPAAAEALIARLG